MRCSVRDPYQFVIDLFEISHRISKAFAGNRLNSHDRLCTTTASRACLLSAYFTTIFEFDSDRPFYDDRKTCVYAYSFFVKIRLPIVNCTMEIFALSFSRKLCIDTLYRDSIYSFFQFKNIQHTNFPLFSVYKKKIYEKTILET